MLHNYKNKLYYKHKITFLPLNKFLTLIRETLVLNESMNKEYLCAKLHLVDLVGSKRA